MNPLVHILASCLDVSRIEGTRLTFRTLRTGFPSADVVVWGNRLPALVEDTLKTDCLKCGAVYVPSPRRIGHDEWIEELLAKGKRPFWIADTDLVFWRKVEDWTAPVMLGRFEEAFVEPWTQTHKPSRLHTSLLYFNPEAIGEAIRDWLVPLHPSGFPFLPCVEMVKQHFVPRIGQPPLFYDTCCGLYQSIGGTAFTPDQNKAFDHLHCATYAHRIQTAIKNIVQVHDAVYADIEKARYLANEQSAFYAANATGN